MIALADHAKLFGARWTSAEIAKIEQGARRPTVATLAILASALTSLRGEGRAPIGLPDLLATDEPVSLTDSVQVADGAALLRVLAGKGQLPKEVVAWSGSSNLFGHAHRGDPPPLNFKLPDDPEEREGMAIFLTLSEQEERIARSMGLDPMVFAACSRWLWSRSFAGERDSRADAGATPQKRGQITRVMKNELREAISSGNG